MKNEILHCDQILRESCHIRHPSCHDFR